MTLNIIKNGSKKLTKGEIELLNKIRKLYKEYQSEAYLYVQPTISNLIPDFILIDEKRGISILEVKDWSLSYIKDINKRRVILADREDDNPISKTTQYYNICNGIISNNDKIYYLTDSIYANTVLTNMSKEDVQVEKIKTSFNSNCINCITKDILEKKTGKKISIDGKAIKSATDKINNGNIPYIVSAFIGEIGLSIGEVKVDDKSNEITAIPELLDLLDIEGATITIDAIGTQEDIVNKIVNKGGHYVLPVKDNQRILKKEIKSQFDSYNNLLGNPEVFHKSTVDKDHGRIEEREYYLTYNTSKITDKEKWNTVNAVAYMRVTRTERDETTITDNYYIIDNKIEIDKLIDAIRDHWNIECGLHWRLDVILDEDHSTNKVGNSIENLSIIRKIIFNLASLDNRFGKVPLQRKLTRYMLDFENIEKLIFEVIPSIS